MSQINVNRIKDSNEGAPDFPSGVNVSGVTSTITLGVTNLNPTNVNVSGVVTATTLDGNLLATGTPTLGLGVTINASGLNISGVATAGIVSATTLYGDGSNMTGIALTIAPLNYNPAVYSQASHLAKASGIGLTFNQGVKAGSGNVTLSLANAGVAGTVVENFGVGNSVTYSNGDTITITPTADLSVGQNYHLSYPSGAFTSLGGDVSYVGTAYTFQARTYSYQLWTWGGNGGHGINQPTSFQISSPTQIPGITWSNLASSTNLVNQMASIKTDGTLWVWGANTDGRLGLNNRTDYSSPVQVGSGTDWARAAVMQTNLVAVKTDGTLWGSGKTSLGALANNLGAGADLVSSPIQIPGTTWATGVQQLIGGDGQTATGQWVSAIKTDGTLWTWGAPNDYGELGHSNRDAKSSPVQIPGTDWVSVTAGDESSAAIRTDGTLWVWGRNNEGQLGTGDSAYSSPKQIPGTTWDYIQAGQKAFLAIKTDGTIWTWGNNEYGTLGHNNSGNPTNLNSPVQVGSDTNWYRNKGSISWGGADFYAIKQA